MNGNEKKQTENTVRNNDCRYYVDMLCNRYRDRGFAAHVGADAAEQERNRSVTKTVLPGAYENRNLEAYKTGCRNGQTYMTADDFTAYYKDGRSARIADGKTYVSELSGRAETEETDETSKKAQWLTETERRALPAILRRGAEKYKSGKLNDLAVGWFPLDREQAGRKKRFKLPIGAIACVVVFVVSMTLIISSNVMVSRITSEISSLRKEGDNLAEECAQLTSEYEVKNDMLALREMAIEYGMVDSDYVASQYMDMGADDMIRAYDADDGAGASPILSAVGGR